MKTEHNAITPSLAEVALHRIINLSELEDMHVEHGTFFIANRDAVCARCGYEGGHTIQFQGSGDGGLEPMLWICAECSNVQPFR